jgi:hypothetical protein
MQTIKYQFGDLITKKHIDTYKDFENNVKIIANKMCDDKGKEKIKGDFLDK